MSLLEAFCLRPRTRKECLLRADPRLDLWPRWPRHRNQAMRLQFVRNAFSFLLLIFLMRMMPSDKCLCEGRSRGELYRLFKQSSYSRVLDVRDCFAVGQNGVKIASLSC